MTRLRATLTTMAVGVAMTALLAIGAPGVGALPIPIGSPIGGFGGTIATTGWQAINGPFSSYADGDPFATHCAGAGAGASSCDDHGTNPLFDPAGQLYGFDVPPADVGTLVYVGIDDPAFDLNGPLQDGYGSNPAHQGFATSYQLFDTTGNPADLSTAPTLAMNTLGLCHAGTPGYQVYAPTHKDIQDETDLCDFTPTVAGTYLIQVRTSGIPGVTDAGAGINDFDLIAETGGSASDQLPVTPLFANSLDIHQRLGPAYAGIADLGTQTAGHTLVVSAFDPGDSPAGVVTMALQGPAGSPWSVIGPGSPPILSTRFEPPCSYSPPSTDEPGTASLTSPDCTITTHRPGAKTPSPYNGKWLTMVVQIPPTYTCTADCEWTLTYGTSKGAISDRLTVIVNLSA